MPGSRSRSTWSRCKGVNEHEIPTLMEWAHGRGFDHDADRDHAAWATSTATAPSNICRCRWCARRLAEHYTLEPLAERTGGPARYVRVAETGGRLGFITPLSHNFCESCNRVRVTCTGTLYMCLGQEDAADLRAPLRASADDALLIGRHRRRHRTQAQRPRFHHRPAAQPPRPRPADVDHGRLISTHGETTSISSPRTRARRRPR